MRELISGYDKITKQLIFRVYFLPIPQTDRRMRSKLSHLTALDLLSAALHRDFGIRNGIIYRAGLEKPKLLHGNLHMNLSHCQGMAAAAVGSVPLGIDVETARKFREKLLPGLCTEQEISGILSAENPEFRFSQYWTLKEAYSKFTGDGIRLPFHTLGFTLSDSPVFHHPDRENVQFYQMILENQHIISLCVPRGEYDVHKPTFRLKGGIEC